MTAWLSADGHAVFCFADGAIGILNRADTPAAFVMLSYFKLRARGAEIFQCAAHMRLVRSGREAER